MSKKRMCKCKEYKMKIIKEGVDDGSTIKKVKRGHGVKKDGSKRHVIVRLIKISNQALRREPYVIYARCSNKKCTWRVIVRGKNKAEAHRRFYARHDKEKKDHG